MEYLDKVQHSFEHAWRDVKHGKADKETAITVGAGVAVLAGAYFLLRPRRYKKKPGASQLTGGGIDREKVQKEFDDYAKAYGDKPGEGITERSKTTELVNVFYDLVTDLYEWGWGQSFHFSPRLPGKDWASSEAAHEARLAALLKLGPGKKCLDVGCGVGGPMRTIASTSGAEVTGITINDYQVSRAKHHNEKLGVQDLCNPVQGNFLKMPFEKETFDGAYAIEATCHANKLEEVYGEVFRVLKPGGMFCSYEWVATKEFDPNDPEHVRIIDEINFGNGLPEMRTYKEAEQAGKHVGFELVGSVDIAVASPVAGPWYGRLKWLRDSGLIGVNRTLVNLVSFLRIAPTGLHDVHEMLVKVSLSLVQGGESGVFSPMHLLIFRKPDSE
ncbi:g998 [Coccomyxa viridis]|uniref:Methyltransferase n=1 Tax=Coccomyxa viridis TaxID=1274662 RepID=A0ABP1FNV1_9CHLO